MNWLILLYFIELGYSPFYDSGNMYSSEYDYIRDESVYYIALDTELVFFNHFFIGGVVKTYIQDNQNSISYLPFESNYLFRTGFRYKHIEIGFKHGCGHGISPWPQSYKSQGYSDYSYEEFYIRISNKR